MPRLTADAAFLVLDFVAGHRVFPNDAFIHLVASLPSVSPRASRRLHKGTALRAVDTALSGADPDPDKARAVLADPAHSPCFPQHLSALSLPLPDLRRLLDAEWANLPPAKLEVLAERIAGTGALHTWANADQAQRQKLRLLVGESREREILRELEKYASPPHPPMAPQANNAAASAPNISGADEAHSAQQQDAEAHLAKKKGTLDHAQANSIPQQEKPVEEAPDAQLPGKLVTEPTEKGKDHGIAEMTRNATASHVTGQFAPNNNKNHPSPGSKRSLMDRNPTASTYEWDGLGSSDHERSSPKRQLPTFEKKPKPSPTFPHKTRKKWSEIQEKTLLEGVEKYGKGNWKEIKMAYPDVFEDRSTVDLKDKFRNMERHQCV